MDQIGDGIKKILKAGIGAVETAVEKSGDVIEQLAEKGTETYNQVVHKGGEIVDKIKKSFADIDVAELLNKPEALADIEKAVSELPKETIQKLRDILDRAEKAIDDKKECCCCDNPSCCNDPISQCDGNNAEKNENEQNG